MLLVSVLASSSAPWILRACLLIIPQSSWSLWSYSFNFFLCCFVLFLQYWGFELRALCLLGRWSNAWATPSVLFTLVILDIGFCFLLRLSWTMILLF
jgi:hypothetical protein